MTDTTPAIEFLEAAGAEHRVVRTQRATSAEESARFQDIESGQLLKSIVVRKGPEDYVFVLVPGDRSIDWKKLRSHLGVSRAALPEKDEAEEVTGYKVGTITPFGSKTHLPVVVDASARDREVVALGAGAPGVNVHVTPAVLVELMEARFADVTKLIADR